MPANQAPASYGYTIGEVADLIGCSTKTVYRWITEGKLQTLGSVEKRDGVWIISETAASAMARQLQLKRRRKPSVAKHDFADPLGISEHRHGKPVDIPGWLRWNQKRWADKHSRILSVCEEVLPDGCILRTTRVAIDANYI